MHYYQNYNNIRYANKFEFELTRNLTRQQGWEAVLRIRVSDNYKIVSHYGSHYMRARNLVCIPCIHADHTIGVEITNGNKLKNSNSIDAVYVQSALLYTTSEGKRRIRVHTIEVPLVNNSFDVIKNINVNSMMTLITRKG
jgi:protein transport protein SEC24